MEIKGKLVTRCSWCLNSELMMDYHDNEWGVPVHDDRKLFEFIVLDAFQAGLSWSTILNKRENFRLAFDNFEADKIALYDDIKFDELVNNAGIIRNRAKIKATIHNAGLFLKIKSEYDSFDTFIWKFTGCKTIVNHWAELAEIPARTEISDAMSKELIKHGFKFVGSTICYAFMQAAGMVNDHIISCDFRR
ncbi:MAG: DNA-3-methyladenine glycosylase I [Candidatus Kapabacteria bacterium]|nr:DNA-3-methyladenine glycosylase I [Candidatus Kapabacteria bacterium]